jgi:transcriptional antiterminator NusG
MKYYAVQVKTRAEEKYIKLYKALHPQTPLELYFPQRQIDIRRRGKVIHTRPAIFPSYVFIEMGDTETIIAHHWDLRRTDGFYRFLRSNQDIQALQGPDLEVVLHFIKKVGPVAGISKVYFNEDARIVVAEGPLKGLEGKIVSVDRRKKRARIKLDLYDESYTIDLAFDVIATASKSAG